MDIKALDNLISQLHAASAAASGKALDKTAGNTSGIAATPTSQNDMFGNLLKNSLDQVNGAQMNAERLTKAYASGASGASLHEVMIASSKANIAFQATVQVRNKLVSAYHDIMSMQL
jgi:flagellar hook-basal body complex protein FliE